MDKLYYCDNCKVTGPIEMFKWYDQDGRRPLIHGKCVNYAFEVGVGEIIFMPNKDKAKEVVKKLEMPNPYTTTFATSVIEDTDIGAQQIHYMTQAGWSPTNDLLDDDMPEDDDDDY